MAYALTCGNATNKIYPMKDPNNLACKQFIEQSERNGHTDEAAAWRRVLASLEKPDPRPRANWRLISSFASIAALIVYLLYR